MGKNEVQNLVSVLDEISKKLSAIESRLVSIDVNIRILSKRTW